MLKFSKSHEWVLTENNTAKVGISKYAAEQLGDIVYVSLPEVSATVTIGKEFSDVESVKAVSSVYSPVSGKVLKINDSLENAPEDINASPMDAWFMEVEVAEIEDGLMDEKQYEEYVKTL